VTTISPTLKTAGLAALEQAVNRALALAPAGQAELSQLAGQVFALHCTAPALDVYLQPTGDGVRLMGHYDGETTTSLRGEASDFAELATADDPAATLINGGLEVGGDSAPLLRLQQIVSRLDVDWEAPLVDTFGDVAGHQLAQTLRGAAGWGRQAGASLTRQLSEFIHEEARLAPPRLELEDFYQDVGKLSERVERLQSRAERLRRRMDRLRGRP
jgi:ubiquinone biosynthesis protein UbiJ